MYYHRGHSPHRSSYHLSDGIHPSPPLAAALDASQVYLYSDDLEDPVSVTDPYYALDPSHGPGPGPDTGHPDHWAATAASGSPSGPAPAPATGTRLFDRTHNSVHGGSSVPGADWARRALEASMHGSVDGGRSVMSYLSPSRHGALRRPTSKVPLCGLDRPLFGLDRPLFSLDRPLFSLDRPIFSTTWARSSHVLAPI